MTAIEIIDQIKALSEKEREMVIGFVHALETAPSPAVVSVDHAKDTDFDKAAKWVFEEHSDLMQKLSQ